MPRRGENIYKRKDGRWEGRISKPGGKYRYFYARGYKEIKEKMRSYRETSEPSEMNRSDTAKNTAAGLLECWLENGLIDRVKPTTYENYYCCMQKYMIPFFQREGNERITEISVSQFVRYLMENQSLSESYKRKILMILKTALKEILKGSPNCLSITEAVRLPKTEYKEMQIFSIKEQRLIETATLRCGDERTLGILLCFYTGIRLGELCGLRWSDFDLDAGTMSVIRTVSRSKNFRQGESKTELLVGTPKSEKSIRKIPLPAFLIELINEYKSRSQDENCYLLTGKTFPLDPRTYQKLYKRILQRAGVKDRKFHAIRHTFATRALELGVDIKTLSEILGHSEVSITLNVYAHSLMEQKKIAMDKFNGMYIAQAALSPFAVAVSVTAL